MQGQLDAERAGGRIGGQLRVDREAAELADRARRPGDELGQARAEPSGGMGALGHLVAVDGHREQLAAGRAAGGERVAHVRPRMHGWPISLPTGHARCCSTPDAVTLARLLLPGECMGEASPGGAVVWMTPAVRPPDDSSPTVRSLSASDWHRTTDASCG